MSLTHFKKRKEQLKYKDKSFFKTSVTLGQKKLKKYYQLSDQVPAYRAAIALHPSLKLAQFKKHQEDIYPTQVIEALCEVTKMWQGYKKHSTMLPNALPPKELSLFKQYNQILPDNDKKMDELKRFLAALVESITNPLIQWQIHKPKYPQLSYMAFDLLAAPAMLSKCEREFLKGGRVLSYDRLRTQGDLAEATECLRSQIHARLVVL